VSDIKGDPAKQPPGCKGNSSCQNMTCPYEGYEGERYRCPVCGESYFLDYEDMK
jgi:hypothetical protein